MAEAKTRATDASVNGYIASRASDEQHADCIVLLSLLGSITGERPKMWGPSMVGYGSYRYTYESGRRGEFFKTGFAIRGRELVVYLPADGQNQAALLAQLGKHKMGKSCLYFKRLADIDLSVLERLIANSVAELQRRYPTPRTTP